MIKSNYHRALKVNAKKDRPTEYVRLVLLLIPLSWSGETDIVSRVESSNQRLLRKELPTAVEVIKVSERGHA